MIWSGVFIFIFIYLLLTVLDLCCCEGVFPVAAPGSHRGAPLVVERGLQGARAPAVTAPGLVVRVHDMWGLCSLTVK